MEWGKGIRSGGGCGWWLVVGLQNHNLDRGQCGKPRKDDIAY